MSGILQNKSIVLALVVAVFTALLGLAYMVWTMPDQRSYGTRISDAFEVLPQGVDKAAEQLKDQSTGEKIKDAAQNLRNDANKSLNQP